MPALASRPRDLAKLPKAHLHLHLEGAMRPQTLTELCARYGMDRPDDTRGRRFDDFGGFLDIYRAACTSIRCLDDLARLVMEVAQDAHQHGVRWLELAYDGNRFSTTAAGRPHQLFDSPRQSWRFVLDAAAAAEAATGVGIAFVSAVDRTQPVSTAVEQATLTAAIVREAGHLIESDVAGVHDGIVAFGLHGNEEGFPPAPFADAFRVALDGTGLLAAPHAGEIAPVPGGGAASVREALDHLGAHRIAHGVLAHTDAALVERLARENICLDVCPSSNLMLNVFDDVAHHPLPALLAAGVPCTLNSDDPLLFGPDLLDEYALCRDGMRLDDAALAQMARTSFVASGAPEHIKQAGLADIEAWLGS